MQVRFLDHINFDEVVGGVIRIANHSLAAAIVHYQGRSYEDSLIYGEANTRISQDYGKCVDVAYLRPDNILTLYVQYFRAFKTYGGMWSKEGAEIVLIEELPD